MKIKFSIPPLLCLALSFLSLLPLTSCSEGLTAEEMAIIAAKAPEGRQDYDGKLLRVWKITDPRDSLLLRAKALPVSEEIAASEAFARLKERMLVTVRDTLDEGVGIAAPQVGISRRFIWVQRLDKPGEPFESYINPEILAAGDSTAVGMEGCLSIPGIYGKVERPQTVRIRYMTSEYKDTAETVRGFTAVIFQHEIDHLDGVLFIDRLVSAQ